MSYPRSYYRTPAGTGFAVNSDDWGVAIQTRDGCSWWPWAKVQAVTQAQAVNEW